MRIPTVAHEKIIASKKRSSRYGINVVIEEVDAAGRSTGEVLAAACNADFLVLGAYNHSRFREFVLGRDPKYAVFRCVFRMSCETSFRN